MDYFCADTPPPKIHFELAGDDDTGPDDLGIMTDEDDFEARLAGAELRELGLPNVSVGMGWRAVRSANHLFEEYRVARAAADVGGPEAAERFRAASTRLLQATRAALTGFPGWNEPVEEQK